jgi:hypothetical protein
LRELDRLRVLRGNPELGRETELGQLLVHGELDRALAVYRAMLPTLRSLAVLGAVLDPAGGPLRPSDAAGRAEGADAARSAASTQRLAAARRQFERDRLQTRPSPTSPWRGCSA